MRTKLKRYKRTYDIGDIFQVKGYLCIVIRDYDCPTDKLCSKCVWGVFRESFLGNPAHYSCIAPSGPCPLPDHCYAQSIADGM